MNIESGTCQIDSGAGPLLAECIKISGRSTVFNAKSVKYNQDELVIVSRTAVKPGTSLIVRIRNYPPLDVLNGGYIRTNALAEVRWVEEVMDEDGLAYEMGLRYVYTD